MELEDVGVVVATRELSLSSNKTVTVLIGKPETFPDGVNYYCPYQIIGLGNQRVRRAGGVDAVQALLLALKMIGADLHTSKEFQSGELIWLSRETRDLGFPVPDSLSDLLPSRQ